MSDTIDNSGALEACIGKTPGAVNLKVIDHLDAGALRWIAASPLMFAAFIVEPGLGITVGGGLGGFARAADATHLVVPTAALDQPQLASMGAGVGTLFLVPGIRETLRVNGRVCALDDECMTIAVTECFMQCAKALIRSDFWSATPLQYAPAAAADFLAASRFMALATRDAQGNVDISPRGDPAGALIRLQQDSVVYADRPGNRRADSFRNILSQPHIASAVLLPGSNRVAVLTGTAGISASDALRADFVVNDRKPLLVTCVDQLQLRLSDSAAIARAQLWPAVAAPADIDPAMMFTNHVKLNKTRGLAAHVARVAVSVPGMMQKGLDMDYKRNLY